MSDLFSNPLALLLLFSTAIVLALSIGCLVGQRRQARPSPASTEQMTGLTAAWIARGTNAVTCPHEAEGADVGPEEHLPECSQARRNKADRRAA